MKKPKLYAVAAEAHGLLETAAVVKLDGRAWIWLKDAQCMMLWSACSKKQYRYQLDDHKLSTIEARYPRHVLGYAKDACGRPDRGVRGDTMVDAAALCRHLEEVPEGTYDNTIQMDLLKALVAEAAKLAPKGKETGRGA